jgi:hypothetical protein
MSASNEWTDWHLTPTGWKRGSEKEDGGGVTKKPVPEDCVLTVRHKEYLSSSFSKLEKTDETSWTGPDERIILELITEFGEAPKHL